MIVSSYRYTEPSDLHFFLAELYKPYGMMGVGIITQIEEHSARNEFMDQHAPLIFGSKTWKMYILSKFENHPESPEVMLEMSKRLHKGMSTEQKYWYRETKFMSIVEPNYVKAK